MCARHTTLTVQLFGCDDTYDRELLGHPGTVTMIVPPFSYFSLFFLYNLFAASVFAANFEVDLIILAFLLWLNGNFLETNYVIKQVF